MEVVFVTFESELSPDALERTLRKRGEKFREVDGLVQKFYLQEETSGRVGGFYIFDSEASRDAFFASDLRDSIGEAYAVTGEPDVSMFHLLFPLREARGRGISNAVFDRESTFLSVAAAYNARIQHLVKL